MDNKSSASPYKGFELGPIRPPSEAKSLMVRITRNCHWNRCLFCPVYKGSRFSIRPVEHVLADLDALARHLESLSAISAGAGILLEDDVRELHRSLPPEEIPSFRAAYYWFLAGQESVFLQDADSLVIKPSRMLQVLERLKTHFPTIKRITSYSRSDTIDRIAPNDLKSFADLGLNRIHIGMESGSDRVLEMVRKGVTKEVHIRAGLKVKGAGIELSEYYMPGLGGVDLYRENALETADAMVRINPEFVRLRTLAIPEKAPIAGEIRSGRFRKCSETLAVEEILLFLENLNGCDGFLASDHSLNLLQELEGSLQNDRQRMLELLETFLAMDPEGRSLFQFGRRTGIFSVLSDMNDPIKLARARDKASEMGVTAENVDDVCDRIANRFI
jgi:hypothetical protein